MTTFCRLEPDGAGKLEDWGLMPAEDLTAGSGQQYGHLWLDDAASGLMVGVWACSPMTGRMGPWSSNEIMILIEGSVVIDHADATRLAVGAGEAFFIPKGTVCSWRQAGNLRKFFVIHSDASGLVAPDPSALRARKIDAAFPFAPAQGPRPDLLIGAAPACEDAAAFTDLTGQLSAGMRRTTPYRGQAAASPRHELMHVLEGEVTLDDGRGRAETFRPGDTCFVPKGAVVGWSSAEPVRTIYATFAPAR